MNPSLRFIVSAAVAALWLQGGPLRAAESLSVGLNLAPMTAQVLVAKERGIFARHGLDVSITTFTSSLGAVESMVSGTLDVALSAEAPITGAVLKGSRIALLASIEYSLLKTLVVSPEVRSAGDLKGRRLGYVASTGSELCAHQLVQRGALAAADVTLLPMLAEELPVAAAGGRIDAYCVWEPYVHLGRKALGERSRLLSLENPYAPTFYIAVADDFARRKPEAAVGFLKSLIEAERWMLANREEAITLVSQAVRMNRAELAEIWSDYVFDVVLEPRVLEPLRRHAQWRIDTAKGHGGAKVVPDVRRLFDTTPLMQAAPERVKL